MTLSSMHVKCMSKTLEKYLLLAMMLLLPSLGNAQEFNSITAANTGAVVYIQIEDSKGEHVGSGTGFIVSSDGYVVTVEHLKVEADQRIWAVIGQRYGTRLPLAYREKDEENDVALWQLPQSNSCRQSVILSNAAVQSYPEPALVLGFPGTQGLTPIPLSILNRSPEHDFYKTDGYLDHGDSGVLCSMDMGA
jgi:S1-C subfamily serine protease